MALEAVPDPKPCACEKRHDCRAGGLFANMCFCECHQAPLTEASFMKACSAMLEQPYLHSVDG